MIIQQDKSIFHIKTLYDHDNHKENKEYLIVERDDVNKLIAGERVIDYYGETVSIDYYEIIEDIVEKTQYEIM